jgi:hypothetical protein
MKHNVLRRRVDNNHQCRGDLLERAMFEAVS